MLKHPRFPLVMHNPEGDVDFYTMDIDRLENIVFCGGAGSDKYFGYQDFMGKIRGQVYVPMLFSSLRLLKFT